MKKKRKLSAEKEAATICSKLRSDSRHRDLPMTLAVDEVIRIRIGKTCHYCGGKLGTRTPCLDRIDNLRGYHADNVVPCCSTCNWARGGLLTYDEFRAAMAVRVERNGWGTAWPEQPERERRIHHLRVTGIEESRLAERVGGVFAARRMARKRARLLAREQNPDASVFDILRAGGL